MPKSDPPKRVRSHALADDGVWWTYGCFPREWVVREQKPDYGIDLEVEVFDEDEYATGMVLGVQVKTIDQPFPSRGTYAYRAEVGWVKGWLSRPYPVVLVCFFATDQRALWLWVKDFVHLTLDPAQPNWRDQAWITLHIPCSREFGRGSMGEVLGYLYARGWEVLIDNYTRLLEAADPRRPPDVLQLALPNVDASELEQLLAVFPDQALDRVRRCHEIVAKARHQKPLTMDDGQYAARHLPRLGFWAAQRRCELSRCTSNLKQLSIAALQYEQDRGLLPSVTEWRTELLPRVRKHDILGCPSATEGGYVLNPAVANKPNTFPDETVLFVDGELTVDRSGFTPHYRHLGGCCLCTTSGSAKWLLPTELSAANT